jgi:hemolysin activation/secretion protein
VILASVLAASLPGAIPQPLIIDQGRADRVPVPELPRPDNQVTTPSAAAAELTRVDATGNNRPIAGIRFEGAKVPAPVAQAAETFLNRPANAQTLKQLAAAMSAAYGKSDIALYTIAIPDQDLSSGTVVIRVAQGFVENIIYPKGASPLMRAYAERLRAIHPLTRSVMERQLSLMRDVTGATVTAQLLRGQNAGGVILSLTIARKRFDATASYDNSRSPLLGRGKFDAELTANSLIRDGDQTKLTGQIARDLHSFAYVALAHSTPLGASGLKLNLSAAYLKTDVESFDLHGNATAGGISLSYPVIRGYRRNLIVSGGIDMVNSNSALFGTVLSSDRIRSGRLSAGYSNAGGKAVLTAGATISKGLGILGARGTPGQSDPRFTKVNVTAGYDRAIGKSFVVRLRGMAQYSGDTLPATERIAVGGGDYGRAFDTAALTGDSGFAGSLEVAARPLRTKRLSGTEIYGFVDHARVYLNDRIGFPSSQFDLGSAGGGVRFAYNNLASVNVEAAKSINEPYAGASDDWRVNFSWKISLARR